MRGIIMLFSIIAGLAYYNGADFNLLTKVKIMTVKKINKGLRPMVPMVEKYNGGKSSLFRKLPPDELASSLK